MPCIHQRTYDRVYRGVEVLVRHGHLMQRQLTAFDFVQIKNIVDKPQQEIAGYRYLAEIIVNNRDIVLSAREICQIDYGVHGSSDVMAHAGEKFRLCGIGFTHLFERVSCLLVFLVKEYGHYEQHDDERAAEGQRHHYIIAEKLSQSRLGLHIAVLRQQTASEKRARQSNSFVQNRDGYCVVTRG